jgi:molybdopterin synthase sulfur carrier subunit
MPRVRFTRNIQRHVECPDAAAEGDSVASVLDAYFHAHPRARAYVLDDQGSLRRHIAIFIDGRPLVDRSKLTDCVPTAGVVDVMQALSGG